MDPINEAFVLRDVNYVIPLSEEATIMETINDDAVEAGMSRYSYVGPSDIRYSIQDIQSFIDRKENFTRDPEQWDTIMLIQSRNLFAMCTYVYDRFWRFSIAHRKIMPTGVTGLIVRELSSLLELCLYPELNKKLINMKLKRLPMGMTPLTKPRQWQWFKFKYIYSCIRRELRNYKRMFSQWRKEARRKGFKSSMHGLKYKSYIVESIADVPLDGILV